MKSVRQHLAESEMNYVYHFKHSMVNAFRLFVLAFTSFVHAIFPQFWPTHAARGVIAIYNGMRRYRHLRRLQTSLKNP